MKEKENFHKECFACGQANESGLQLQFVSDEHQVVCRTKINKLHQSYGGIVHGGIIATLLDAAMVQCLHKKFGKNPLTCRLDIRYREVVPTNSTITVNASFKSRRGMHCWAEAIILSKNQTCVSAQGTFKLT
jgi:acyl-coenzyme A thioesterase PaaI-like protein